MVWCGKCLFGDAIAQRRSNEVLRLYGSSIHGYSVQSNNCKSSFQGISECIFIAVWTKNIVIIREHFMKSIGCNELEGNLLNSKPSKIHYITQNFPSN